MTLLERYPALLRVALTDSHYPEHADLARQHGVSVEFGPDCIEVGKASRILRLHKRHIVYLKALIRFFEYYWESVEPRDEFGKAVCDFTPSRYHRVVGFDLMPVLFPSLAEPVATIDQYLDFAQLAEGQTVVDLGAYAGLSSILFRQELGKSGRVVALEPDPANFACASRNLDLYKRLTGLDIELVPAALWVDDQGLAFSADGCMGSSAVDYVGRRGQSMCVATMTLDQLADRYAIKRVDFLKCDIEGAEDRVFKDSLFLRQAVRKLVVEIHRPPAGLTSGALVPQLESLGFRCELVTQYGVDLPLLCAVNGNP